MKAELVKNISKDLHLSEEEVLEESISSFLDRSLCNASVEIEKLRNKYDVDSPEELEEKIEKGEVDAHPAWEELIEWENLNKQIVKFKEWMKKISTSS